VEIILQHNMGQVENKQVATNCREILVWSQAQINIIWAHTKPKEK